MASVSIRPRKLMGYRIVRRNCICSCGTQVRAPISVLTKGMDCPNCGRKVLFEEQFDPDEVEAFGKPLGLLGDQTPLDFNTKPFSFLERVSVLPKWMLLAPLIIVVCVALGLLFPSVLSSLRIESSPNAKTPPVAHTTTDEQLDWSKISRWNLASESGSGSIDAARIAKEFTNRAAASEYEKIARLFDYQRLSAEVYSGRQAKQAGTKQSLEVIEKDLNDLIKGFLADSQRITPGSHDFRMIGYTVQGSTMGILLRYYRESATPVNLLDSEDILLPMTKLIRFDNFQIYCDNIFRTKLAEPRSNPRLQGYMYTNFFADKHFGYLVLLVKGKGANAQIEDMFDLQLKKPLSQYCLVWTDASGRDISQIPSLNLQTPGPSESDLQFVQNWIKNRKDRFRQFDLTQLRATLNELYTQTKDPLMQDLLGRLESDAGNRELSSEHFRRARADNFKSLDGFRNWMLQALEAGDREQLVERLHELNHHWDIKLTGLDAEEDRKMFHKFQGYWRRGESL
jgi:DNA-directed RNA polymerase subunit RPC12/RpoP